MTFSFTRPGYRLACSYVLLSAFLFSLKGILIKYAFGIAPKTSAIELLVLRMLVALPFFILMIALTQKPQETTSRRQWLKLWIAGLLGYYAASILDFIGLTYILHPLSV